MPSLVLWQQGEADAQLGTSTSAYLNGLLAISETLVAAGVQGPILLAKSTVCRSEPDQGVRTAIAQALHEWPERFRPGPDTDVLIGHKWRYDGCHFSAAGLDRAARQWADSIGPFLIE